MLAFSLPANAAANRCQPLRAMSFNIRLDLDSDGDNRWALRREEFVGQIDLLSPDLIGLQEVVPGQKRDLENKLPGYRFLGVARDDGRDKGEYSTLAYRRDRYTLTASGTFWLSPTPTRPSKGWDAAYPRIATWAHLVRKGDGRRILALNTHLDNAGATARLEGARQIGAFLAAQRRPDEAVVMTGDLNTGPASAPIAALTQGPAALRDSRMDGARPALGSEVTFNDFYALPTAGERIDYVLHDRALRTKRNATLSWYGDKGRVASDHFAVVADLVEARCPR